MKLGTANICNKPDMAPAKVRADARKMGAFTTIWGGQEIDPLDDDFEQVMEGLGSKWRGTWSNKTTPIFFSNKHWNMIDRVEHKLIIPNPFGRKDRSHVGIILRRRDRPKLPPFAVVNSHFIANAWNNPDPQHADLKDLREIYHLELTALNLLLRSIRRKGLTTFFLGDYNNPNPQLPVGNARNARWLVGSRLDRIGMTTTGSIDLQVKGRSILNLNSDHNAQIVSGVLRRA